MFRVRMSNFLERERERKGGRSVGPGERDPLHGFSGKRLKTERRDFAEIGDMPDIGEA